LGEVEAAGAPNALVKQVVFVEAGLVVDREVVRIGHRERLGVGVLVEVRDEVDAFFGEHFGDVDDHVARGALVHPDFGPGDGHERGFAQTVAFAQQVVQVEHLLFELADVRVDE